MKKTRLAEALSLLLIPGGAATVSAQSSTHDPTWWEKYQFLSNNGADPGAGATSSAGFGKNVDVSNECGPQSETFITVDPSRPRVLAAGSNEICRLPKREISFDPAASTRGRLGSTVMNVSLWGPHSLETSTFLPKPAEEVAPAPGSAP